MSAWKINGQAGWDEKTGNAVYHVTKGSKSLNVQDHAELTLLLNTVQKKQISGERMAAALSSLTVHMAINDQDGVTELSDSFCEAREALGEWRELNK